MEEYFRVFGLNPGAGLSEVEKAFRKLALQFHPDRNPGDASAEEKFKQIKFAYDVIKSGRPPRYRPSTQSPPQPTPKKPRRQRPNPSVSFGGTANRGDNIAVNVEISFEESFTGCEKAVSFYRSKHCQACGGEGGLKSSYACSKCKGTGRLAKPWDSFLGNPCPACRGSGRVYDTCDECLGSGKSGKTHENVKVVIPAGIVNGMQVRISGIGEQTQNFRGRPGDLIVFVAVKDHEFFKRKDNDLIVEIPLAFSDVCLGRKLNIPLIGGGRFELEVPGGVQSGTRFRVKGRGFSSKNEIGDLVAIIKAETPIGLADEYRAALLSLAEIEKKYITPGRKAWEERLK